ncbi:MAG: prolyl oligopeptidase family serine peptidase [Planctomycetaceae bacterium]|nr:prolyl oligopeptidase family serine peptidase [Planctomycetaceae bacterium]
MHTSRNRFLRLDTIVCVTLLLGATCFGLASGCRQSQNSNSAPSSQAPAEFTHNESADAAPTNLLEARRGFDTDLAVKVRDEEILEIPNERLFDITACKSSAGSLEAYISLPPEDGKVYPAMIWVTGGFPPGGIGSQAWEPVDPSNDQSAKVYRERGMIMMYPTLRGCSDNPGFQEGFYGEVEDLIAAGEYLRKLPCVDPERVYLGGHSTGGTLVLLVAESTDIFRGVISFGPVEDPFYYGEEHLRYKRGRIKERILRAPIHHLDYIRTPTVVVEGTQGNIGSLMALQAAGSGNSNLSFVAVPHQDHFNVLAPVNAILAEKIVSQPSAPLTLTVGEVVK